MNKIQLFGLLFIATIAIYGVTTIYADSGDNATGDMDGSGMGSGYGHHYGDMDGSQSQDRMQLRDGSGAGGMYGNGTGDCDNY